MPYKDRQKRLDYAKKYRKNNLEKCKQLCRNWNKSHPGASTERMRKWQRENPDKVKQKRLKLIIKNIDWFKSWLGQDKIKCSRCQYVFDDKLSAMQIHHINPIQKENIHDIFARWKSDLSLKRFKQKILNTEFSILCANCHAEHRIGVWK